MNVLRGIFSIGLIIFNTLLACVPLYLMGLVRVFLRGRARQRMNRLMDGIIDYWVGCNRLLFRLLGITRVDVTIEGEEELARDRWYLVVCNHQSWADILILQTTLWGRIPPIKFFTKQQLIWIPLLGLAMWLLGFPYVRRMSRDQIAANPGLVELDRAATLAACEGFRDHPTTVLNFLEGTRFTPEKHATQDARFRHLLNPKLGGMSYVVNALSDRLQSVLDVTITYPGGTPTFWDLMQGRCREVGFLVQCRPLPESARAATDAETARNALAPWVEDMWREKDTRLDRDPARPAGARIVAS
ncbi:MAG: 1-acyl-sn-glycerol-3-phosphate acyltransferase [Pseudomonadales bacterium]|nr:1-acyl-sn-glycerol-3-phosphate acyltransferase [Pseudomonadales bacterium]